MNSLNINDTRKIVNQVSLKFVANKDSEIAELINRQYEAILNERQKKLASSRENLLGTTPFILGWIKKVEAIKWESQRPLDKTEVKHNERMNEIEKERFILVKSIDDVELSTQQLSSQIKSQEQKLNHLKTQVIAADSPMMSQEQYVNLIFFRLQFEMYRSLGIEWLENEIKGQYKLKCRIRSKANNDIFTFALEDYNNMYFCTNYIWDLCE